MIVYYGSINSFFPIQPPRSLLQDISKNNKAVIESRILKCPAITNFYKNIFAIYPTYDYNFKYKDKAIRSSLYDQEFFDKVVNLRNVENGLISYNDPTIVFFSESSSSVVETMPPFLHMSKNKCQYILGSYDVGKHLRPLEIPLILKEDEEYSFDTNTPVYYVKFITQEKITFKRFNFTDELKEMVDGLLRIRNFSTKTHSLEFFYELVERYNYKKKYLKIIKQNLFD